MKKYLVTFLSLILMSCLFFSVQTPLVKAAASENLVTNPGFEDSMDGWDTQSTVTIEDGDVVNSGDNSCWAHDRVETWASPLQDLTDVLSDWGPGDYLVSVYVKIDGDTASDKMQLVFNSTYDDQHTWLTASGDINNKGFTKIEGTITLAYTSELGNVIMYLQAASATPYDYFCDDFSVQKVNGKKEGIVPPSAAPLQEVTDRPEETLVGAIRWDAWLNPTLKTFNAPGTSAEDYIGAQMVRSLSPTQYHFRLPYFGIVESKDKVNLPDYTQELFDQEMLYAKEAGIDYFMYCWYEDGSGMDTARKLHTTSKYKDDVKMSAMWDITKISSGDLSSYLDILKQSYWQKVSDGRPLVYVNAGDTQTVNGIAKFRKACLDAGLKNPYLVGLSTFGSTAENVTACGIDALSDYAIGGGGAKPYSSLMSIAEAQWKTDMNSGVQYIPLVPTGWDRRPRIDNPVTWEGPTSDKSGYIQTASAQEIAALLQKALDLNEANPEQSNINSVLIYAWNEHDEGGWLCPTIIDDDGDGLPEKRADGTNARDTRRLQAIQQVLRPGSSWTLDKDIDLSVVYPSPSAKMTPGATRVRSTEQPTATAVTGVTGGSGWLLYAGIGAAIVVIGAGVMVFLKSKKGKDTAA